MEEDATVGVQLLLEDGVSDALAAMMKQLDAADRAIAATAANWEGFPVGDSVPLSPASPIDQYSDIVAIPTITPEIGILDLKAPSLVPGGNVVVETPSSAPPQLPAAQDGPSSRLDGPPTSYVPTLSAEDEADLPWLTTAIPPTIANDERPSTQSVQYSAPIDINSGSPASPLPGARDFGIGAAADSIAPFAPDTPPVAPFEPAGQDDGNWAFQSQAASAPTVALPSGSVAPRAADMASPAPSVDDVVPSGGSASDAMAIAPSDPEGGGEGQLMLDGSLLGRWIIDHLSREADRPPAAGTAFDPRQGYAWSGGA